MYICICIYFYLYWTYMVYWLIMGVVMAEVCSLNYGTNYWNTTFTQIVSSDATSDFSKIVFGGSSQVAEVYQIANNSITRFQVLPGISANVSSVSSVSISEDGQTLILLFADTVYVYTLHGLQYTLYQSVDVNSTTQLEVHLFRGSDYFAVRNSSRVKIYKFDSTQYGFNVQISNNAIFDGFAMTDYLDYLVTFQTSSGSIKVYKDFTRSGVPLLVNISILNSSISCVSMTNTMNDTKHGIVIGFSNGSVRYYELDEAGALTLQQSFNYGTAVSQIKITKNGLYLLIGLNDGKVILHQRSTTNSTNLTYSNVQNFTATNAVTSLLLSQSSNIIVISDQSGSTRIYYECQILNCIGCSSLNQYQTCNSTFTLNNNSCSCTTNETLSFTTALCTSCNVVNCSRCDSNNTCAFCSNGLSVVNNSCVCPSNFAVSSITNTCLNCTVPSCTRCDLANVCGQCMDGYALLENGSCICAQGRTVSLTTGECVLCNVTYCSNCNQSGFCGSCLTGFTLSGGACSCSTGKTINSSNMCVNCFISFCSKCQTANVCSVCFSGFTLTGPTCSCSFGNTISLIDSFCYPCSVNNCLRCDSSNFCGLCKTGYSLLSTGSCACEGGKTVSLTTAACVLCNPLYCSRCDTANFCGKCVQGYSVSTLGTCTQDNKKVLWSEVLLILTFLVLMVVIGVLVYLKYKLYKSSKVIKSLLMLNNERIIGNVTLQQMERDSDLVFQNVDEAIKASDNKLEEHVSLPRNIASITTVKEKGSFLQKDHFEVQDYLEKEDIQRRKEDDLGLYEQQYKDVKDYPKKKSRVNKPNSRIISQTTKIPLITYLNKRKIAGIQIEMINFSLINQQINKINVNQYIISNQLLGCGQVFHNPFELFYHFLVQFTHSLQLFKYYGMLSDL